METQQAIEKRRGCRKYTDQPVDKEKIGLVLDAGRLAPSAGNLQDRGFIVVKDDKKKADIAVACGNQTWMQTAPVYIVVLSENKKLSKFFGAKGEKIYSIQDTSFAVENMLLAATDLGLGCSLVVGFSEEKLNDILGMKEPAQIHAIITLGYPADNSAQSAKYPLEKFVYFEKYGEKIENAAAAFGEWSTAREKLTADTVKAVKRESRNIFQKIISMFKKKEKDIGEDHFLEQYKPAAKETEHEKEAEIPRILPRTGVL